MEALALIILVLFSINVLTPGSIYKVKPEIDTSSPKLYISLANTVLIVILAVLTIL